MERVVDFGDERSGAFVGLAMADACAHGASLREEIVRCRHCKWFDAPRLCRRDMSCDEIAVDVEPNGFCAWGERRDDDR